MPKDEIEIITAILNGDKDAFKIFVELYQRFVLNICYKFVNNEDDANDIAQEVFIEVFRTIDKFRKDSKITTWLYRISVNRSINFLRDNKKHRETEHFLKNNEMVTEISHSSDNNPDTLYINEERKNVLDNAIKSLPERQRTAFILNKKEMLTAKEISEILNLSLKSVESLISRAKLNLQKFLIEYYKS